MGEENECVFGGAACFLQNQICGKPAEPTLCLAEESGFLTVSRSWEKCIHLLRTLAMRGRRSTTSQASPVSFDWLEMYATKCSIVGSMKSLWRGPFRFEFCGSHTSVCGWLLSSPSWLPEGRIVRSKNPHYASSFSLGLLFFPLAPSLCLPL